MTGLEKKYITDYRAWDEVGCWAIYFYNCQWTDHTKKMFEEQGKDLSKYHDLVVDSEKSTVQFYGHQVDILKMDVDLTESSSLVEDV
ncbi:hypothetical protein [Vibrio phage RYC]|nr:hypothetical protein [Vibrio phage RYC]